MKQSKWDIANTLIIGFWIVAVLIAMAVTR